MGQGDSALVRTPSGRTILIDGGGRPEQDDTDIIGMKVIEPFLRRQIVNRIDIVVLTHPHDDHIQGLIPVLRDFRVGMVLDPGIPHGSESYRRFLSMIQARHIPYRRAVRGQVISFGDGVEMGVLHPPPELLATDDENDNSAVLRFTYGKSAVLFTGDAGEDAESDILASGADLRSDVLKVGHHGSGSSSSLAWLDAVRPRLAVISVGATNPFGHPSPDVLARLSSRKVRVLRTDQCGAVTLSLSRNGYSVHTCIPSKAD